MEERIRQLGSTAERMLGKADAALYEAKNGGRNRVVLACSDEAAGMH